MAEIKGIDVSKWQGDIDWAKVKADGIEFVIIRAGYGRLASQKDVKFEEYYRGARAAGIPMGAYWYSYAKTAEDAKKEAEACYECIKGKGFQYPVFFDYEDACQRSTEMASAVIPAFIDTLSAKGYYTELYSYKNLLDTIVPADIKTKYGLWLAHYTTKTGYTGKYNMWQHTSSGKVNGISGNVDMNVCYVDYPAIIEASGKTNGGEYNKKPHKPSQPSSPTPVAPEKKPVVEVSKPVIDTKPVTDSKPKVEEVSSISKGDVVTLNSTKLYSSAYSKEAAATKTGTFYVYNGEKVGNRYAITNSKDNVGKTPMGNYVTGWIDADSKCSASIDKGDVVTLNSTKLYSSAYTKKETCSKTGTFYVYNGSEVNGRYAITNSKDNVGKTPMGNYVTGWINKEDVK